MAKYINGQKIVDAVFEGGLVGNPSIRFANSLLDGFYRKGTNNIGLSLNGARVFDVTTGIYNIAIPINFDTGVAITAGNYQIGRDADGTNQLHFNVPTGAGYEFSINDVSVLDIDSAGTLTTSGQIIKTYDLNAATYAITTSDYCINCRYTITGAITDLALPAITDGTVVDGRVYLIVDSGANAGTNNITITRGHASDKIDNATASYVIGADKECIHLKANTTTANWEIIN